jgi:hypothetical protein
VPRAAQGRRYTSDARQLVDDLTTGNVSVLDAGAAIRESRDEQDR